MVLDEFGGPLSVHDLLAGDSIIHLIAPVEADRAPLVALEPFFVCFGHLDAGDYRRFYVRVSEIVSFVMILNRSAQGVLEG